MITINIHGTSSESKTDTIGSFDTLVRVVDVVEFRLKTLTQSTLGMKINRQSLFVLQPHKVDGLTQFSLFQYNVSLLYSE